MLYGLVVVGKQVINRSSILCSVHFSSRISKSLGFGISDICLTSQVRPEEDKSVETGS